MGRNGPSAPTERPTREFCQRCHRLSPIGFHARDDIWEAVAGGHWRHSILCIVCFAALGDEKHVQWEIGLEFHPVSYVTFHDGPREGGALDGL